MSPFPTGAEVSPSLPYPGQFFDKGGVVYNVMHPDFGAVGDGVTDDTAAIEAVIAAVPAYSTIVFPPDTYLIGTVNCTKPLRMVCWGARFTLSGDNAGFTVDGTVAWFRVEGGHITGDGVNRDASPATRQIGWQFGDGVGDDVADVEVDGVRVDAANIGIKVAYGVTPNNFVERVRIHNCQITGIIGIVAGVGYGIQITQAPGTIVSNCYIEDCERHGLYISEGENYIVQGVHIENCGPDSGAIRGAMAISRSANVSVSGCNFHDNKDAALVIDVDTGGTAPNTLEGVTVVGNTFSDNKYGDLVIGTVNPATDGVPSAITFHDNTIVSLAAVTTLASSIVIRSGNRISIKNNNIDSSKITGTTRVITLLGSGGATYTDDVTISKNSIDASNAATVGYGIQVASALCTGTQRFRFIENDIQAGDGEFEFLSGEASITNNNLRYTRSDGKCLRDYTGTGGTGGSGVTVPAGGVDALYLLPGSALFIENFSGAHEGQELVLHFGNGNTTVNNNAIYTEGALDIVGSQHDIMKLVFSQGAWRQVAPLSAN